MAKKDRVQVNLHLPEHLRKLKRGPQALVPKDIGMILAYTDINKESVVLDAGFGSGFLAISMARFVKQVFSYEIREDFYKQGLKNITRSGCKNITLINKDITKGIEEPKEFDLITLDLPEPEKPLELVIQKLKQTGTIVVILPTIEQVKRVVEKANQLGLSTVVTETSVREWKVGQNATRPIGKQLVHTTFLIFMKKKVEEKSAENQTT